MGTSIERLGCRPWDVSASIRVYGGEFAVRFFGASYVRFWGILQGLANGD
ncbi:MAG TPA: hypothetical protein PK256_19110 [Verrucomicrobiota bacterium]|nr:hypothetical protein [Verrucomicrobiota bacterium]